MRELDAQIAEKVFEIKVGGTLRDGTPEPITVDWEDVPRYSTNIADAWTAVDKMIELEPRGNIRRFEEIAIDPCTGKMITNLWQLREYFICNGDVKTVEDLGIRNTGYIWSIPELDRTTMEVTRREYRRAKVKLDDKRN